MGYRSDCSIVARKELPSRRSLFQLWFYSDRCSMLEWQYLIKIFVKENALWFMYCNKLKMSKQWNCKTSELLMWVTLTSTVTSSLWCVKYLVFRIVANGRTSGYLSVTFLLHAWAFNCARCLKEAFEAAHGGRILLLCVPVKKCKIFRDWKRLIKHH